MNKQRLRDVALGFLFCLALVGSYYCGASGNPTNANASSMGSSGNAIVGGVWEGTLYYAVVDVGSGRIQFSERVSGTAVSNNNTIQRSERYW